MYGVSVNWLFCKFGCLLASLELEFSRLGGHNRIFVQYIGLVMYSSGRVALLPVTGALKQGFEAVRCLCVAHGDLVSRLAKHEAVLLNRFYLSSLLDGVYSLGVVAFCIGLHPT